MIEGQLLAGRMLTEIDWIARRASAPGLSWCGSIVRQRDRDLGSREWSGTVALSSGYRMLHATTLGLRPDEPYVWMICGAIAFFPLKPCYAHLD
jgi:hypothetical protein